jgi:hemoglobin/transferrin/lactoferrin receptor protein
MYWGGFSQTIKVTNQQTSTPLEGVNISSTTVGKSIDTDAEGQAQISVFKGSEDILLRLPGFKSLSLSYNQIQSTQFKVEMIPINFNLD